MSVASVRQTPRDQSIVLPVHWITCFPTNTGTHPTHSARGWFTILLVMMEVVPGKQRSTLQKHTIFHDNSLPMTKNYFEAIKRHIWKLSVLWKVKNYKIRKIKINPVAPTHRTMSHSEMLKTPSVRLGWWHLMALSSSNSNSSLFQFPIKHLIPVTKHTAFM